MASDSPPRLRASVLAIFFLSGVSGLVYQVIWVRQLGNVFGNTVQSASLVAGVFMAGLGAGAYFLGRAGDKGYRADPTRPLRLYARAELLIAALGLVLALLLPRLHALSAAISSYTRGEHGWFELSTGSYALRYTVAVLLLVPPTFLMGGTLTLLIRFLATDLEGTALRIGLLYGANTAGAALGALLTDLVLVPALGIFSTQLVAVVINATAGVLALLLARRAASPAAPAPAAAPDPAPAPAAGPVLPLTAVSLALAGFAAMGLEILWFRFLSGILGQFRAVFSVLLAVLLTGIWLGAVAGGWLARRFGRPERWLAGAQCALAAVTLGLLGFVDYPAMAHATAQGFVTASEGGRWLVELWTSLKPIAVAVGLPSLLMGMTFPLANAYVQRTEEKVGGSAGLLYLANTSGNVLGCALTGFFVLPAVGIQATALVLACAAAAAAVPLYVSSLSGRAKAESRSGGAAFAVSIGVAAVAVAAFAALPGDRLLRASLPGNDEGGTRRVLTVSEGTNEALSVVDVPGFFVQLYTSGHSMSSTHPKAQRYMRAFAHVPLLQMEHPERALVICFGVGNTTHAASLHAGLTRIDVADLSRGVLEHAGWFSAANHDVLQDPRVSVFVNDGRHHLLMQPEGTYDLITLEPPPIAFAGVASLYSREMYELAKSRLKPGGYMTQWLPAYQVPTEQVRAAVRAFVDVFPESVLLSGDDNELVLMGTRGPSIRMDPVAVARRLAAAPAVAADMARIDLGDMKEIAGMFAASHATMVAATKDTPPVTDDRPSLEYGVLSNLRDQRMPRDLFDTAGIDAWCEGCTTKIPGLAGYLKLRGLVYASDAFLVTPAGAAAPAPFQVPEDRETLTTLADSPYLRGLLLGGPGAPALRRGIEHLRAGRLAEAKSALLRALWHDPTNPATYAWLGRTFAAAGDPDSAARALEQSVRLDPKNPVTRFTFADVLRTLKIVDGGIEQYRAGLALDPMDTDARYELGVLLQQAGRRDEAERELAVLLDVDPQDPRANLVLCKRAAAKGDLDAAAGYCEVARSNGGEVPAELWDKVRSRR
jgi:spermidine synthase